MSNTSCHPDLLQFWRLLADGTTAGRQLGSLLQEISLALPPEPMGNAAAALAQDLLRGETLSQAMARQPAVFTKAHICLIEGGEYVGRIDRILSLIVELTEDCPQCGGLRFPTD